MTLRTQVHGINAFKQVVVAFPAAGDLRSERRSGPGVHDIGVADESIRCTTLVGSKSSRALGLWIDGEVSLIGHQRLVIQRFAIGIQAIPERERNPKEPLTTNQPVAVEAFDPVVVAGLHVGRMPGDLVGALQHDIA
ncbi:unannotated protein [freshwater metagenome]|uniref:Unannotated protein n=1 Tax=freshwater metagenome TaxID=449393 RepID=A0A6J6BKX3_9ZZZZ